MNTWGSRIVVLFLLFFVALAGGFWLFGSYQAKQQQAERARIEQQQAYERQTAALRQQEEEIRQQRQALEEERRALEQQKRDMEEAAARAQGRNEQIDEEQKGISSVGQIWDQMTGKEEERRQARRANEDIREQARRGAQEIQASIEQAGEMIAVLNERIEALERVKQQVQEMKETAENAYAGNQEAMQKMVSYLAMAAAWLKEHW